MLNPQVQGCEIFTYKGEEVFILGYDNDFSETNIVLIGYVHDSENETADLVNYDLLETVEPDDLTWA